MRAGFDFIVPTEKFREILPQFDAGIIVSPKKEFLEELLRDLSIGWDGMPQV